MWRSFAALSLAALALLVSSQYAQSQLDSCPTLPDPTVLEKLIRNNIAGSEGGRPPASLAVTVRKLNYVCLVSGVFRDTYRKLSVVVSYDCSGSILCPSASPVSQFDFTCNSEGMWEDDIFGTSDFSRRDVADASLTTPNRTNCSFCIAPNHPVLGFLAGITRPYDETTHCIGMLARSDSRRDLFLVYVSLYACCVSS